MGSEAVQITIPDFDDDDVNSTPHFGRSQASFWGTSAGSGSESPTILTPVLERNERTYFHSRGDSVTSEDSSHSIQHTGRKLRTPFSHSTQSSVATTSSSPFTKKGSFASLRNPFKSSKSNEAAPPLPPLDQQAYPALKNPFNRSTSSLAQHASRPSTHASPPQLRPSTPASNDSKARRTPSRSISHSVARSQHSYSGSIFHFSDGDSDAGHGFSLSSPPPVPPVPHTFSNYPDSIPETDEQIMMDAKTPSDFALHAVFIRFAAAAESFITDFIAQPYDREPTLDVFMGPGVDVTFDGLLQSLGKIAQKHAKSVVESILRWRRSQVDGTDLQRNLYSMKATRAVDSTAIVAERKMLTSTYIMCRALVVATKEITKDSLGEAVGNSLEEMTFEQFRRPDHKTLSQSVNHRAIADLYAILLGNLSEIRFESVTDRFLRELSPIAAGQVPKDSDFKFETLVKGLRYVQIKVWPPERFEEGAEFFEALSKSFGNAHGIRLKSVFAETLMFMLHPIAKTAQAEVNHPDWAKAIEMIYPKARDMMSKPRYWHVAYPLSVTSLCVAPTEFFLRNWISCFEAGLGKMRERPYRMTVLNGMMRLVWTYLYRCHEPASTVSVRLESLAKHFFPPNKHTIVPQEERLEPFIYIVHFILSRHIDVGSEICLELLQARLVGSQPNINLAPERTAIAAQAILLTIHLFEREESVPAWPSSPDFMSAPSTSEYPTSSAFLVSPMSRSGVQDLLEQSSSCLTTLARLCFHIVGRMSILDDKWSSAGLAPTFEEVHSHVIRHHPEGTFAYPQALLAQISILQTAFQTWPRLLHSSNPLEDALDMLLRGVVHVEPAVGEAAEQALTRILQEDTRSQTVLSRCCALLFDPQKIINEGSGARIIPDCMQLLELWFKALETWVDHILSQPAESLTDAEKGSMNLTLRNSEAGCLFLLASYKPHVITIAVKAIRRLGALLSHIHPSSSSPRLDAPEQSFEVIYALLGSLEPHTYLGCSEDLMSAEELISLKQWRESSSQDIALHIATSEKPVDRNLWLHIYPAFLQACAEYHPPAIDMLREMLKAAASRYHPVIFHLSGVSIRSPVGVPQRSGSGMEKEGARAVAENRHLVHQWHSWLKLLCAIAPVPDVRSVNRDHSRARSEANVQKESLNTSRDLFKYLSQFLDSDHSIFRDIAVSCISSLSSHGYSILLEDLSNLAARQFYDDPRSKSGPVPSIGRVRRHERFHTAVARIYFLTAHCLQSQRSSSKQIALTNVLKYVRNMQTFLSTPENRDMFSLQRLRRYFCGAVERLFDGLATLKDSDRFIPHGMHLALYRMCEEWCQLGRQSDTVKKRLVTMQSAAAHSYQDPALQAEAIQRFQTETRALSNAAVGAMASLIHKAFFPPDITASPVENAEQYEPLKASQTLERLTAILASYNDDVQGYGKKALRSLLLHATYDSGFAEEALRRAFVTTRELDTSNARFFEILCEVSCTAEHGFNFSQIVCLGLSNLCHPLSEIRYRAFNMLEAVHEQASGIISMVQYEAAVGSSAPSTYLHAHRLISDVLSGEHPDHALNVLAQFAGWIPKVFEKQGDRGVLILLQSLEFWVPSIDLMAEDKLSLSREGRSAIYHLVSLTLRYGETHAEQIFVLWTRLVDAPYQSNGHAVIRFLLEESSKVGSALYASCAAKIVACLSQSAVGRELFEELCSVVEPARMIPSIQHRLAIPDAEELEMWSDLDILFSDQPRMSLGVAQFSLLFLSETAMDRYWDFQDELPILLHGIVMHLDHRLTSVRQRTRHLLYQVLRSCIPGYDELPDRTLYPPRAELRDAISQLQEDAETQKWRDDDSGTQTVTKMRWLCTRLLDILEPLYPSIAEAWGALALQWAVECPVRPIAFRSLQLFRALMPKWGRNDVAQLLGRLSITISDTDPNLNKFNLEILMTLTAMASSDGLEAALPQMFWCAAGCLLATAEEEFGSALKLLNTLLDRIDLDDPQTADLLTAQQPPNWQGFTTLQSSLLMGLRSSCTFTATFKVLQHLARIGDSRLIDPTEGRVRDLYTLSLPWCLHAMYNNTTDEALEEFTLNIAHLAEEEERPSLTRIMTSFAKGRFRTKDDFLRQSVAALREHYGAEHWTEVMTLLMGLVLNSERWLRVRTMQILKVLFQQRETRAPVDLLGSELLMPLLRLLETDLATEALDVLEEPMQIYGGPSARHVLRMSLHHHSHADAKEVESVAEVFGIAQESGWCVPQAHDRRETCRANIRAVFDSCQVHSRPSRIDFQPDEISSLAHDSTDNLGELVQNLHELSSFFQEQRASNAVLNRHLEARITAIVAKSSEDVPQTPLVDIFDIGSLTPYRDSGSPTSSDTDSDLFEFDSPQVTQHANGIFIMESDL